MVSYERSMNQLLTGYYHNLQIMSTSSKECGVTRQDNLTPSSCISQTKFIPKNHARHQHNDNHQKLQYRA